MTTNPWVASILNEIKNSIFDFYLHQKTVLKLNEKYQLLRLDKVSSEIQNRAQKKVLLKK